MKNYLDSRYMAMAWDAMGTTFDSLIDPLFKINSLLARLQDLASDLSQLQEDTPGFFLGSQSCNQTGSGANTTSNSRNSDSARKTSGVFSWNSGAVSDRSGKITTSAKSTGRFLAQPVAFERLQENHFRTLPIRKPRRFLGAIRANYCHAFREPLNATKRKNTALILINTFTLAAELSLFIKQMMWIPKTIFALSRIAAQTSFLQSYHESSETKNMFFFDLLSSFTLDKRKQTVDKRQFSATYKFKLTQRCSDHARLPLHFARRLLQT